MTNGKTQKNKKNQLSFKKRQREKGLNRHEYWCTDEQHEIIKEFIKKVTNKLDIITGNR